MFYVWFFLLFCGVLAENVTYYDSFTGNTVSVEEFMKYEEENTTFWCAGKYEPCDPKEGRRLDLSCNNLKLPNRGTPHTPYRNELPLLFEDDNGPIKAQSGEDLPPARKARLEILPEGVIPDQRFTILFVHYLLFGAGSQATIHDTINYSHQTTTCCKPEGRNNPMCFPMKIASDDTVHQFSGLRCMNMTKPLTFQTQGCLRNPDAKPERINTASVFMDLTAVYGLDDSFRSMEDGKLKVDIENGRVWPVGGNTFACIQNNPPQETRCHLKTELNSLFGINFIGTMFWRLHNYLAEELRKINPCWDDNKLFYYARELNIAFFVQIYYYDLLVAFLGKPYLLRHGLISQNGGFRDLYQEDLTPQLSLEYTYVLRWGHTIQPGLVKLFDESGNYNKQIPAVNLTLRTGYLPLDNNMEGVTQGAFRQPAARFDHIVDPSIAQNGLPGLQHAFDIMAADLVKGPLQGMESYINYRQLCSGRVYNSYEDLAVDMVPENIEMLRNTYNDVKDVPLMAGVWLEKLIPGGHAPKTLACLKTMQLRRFIQYDRHWYERPNRPNAFTWQQLREIRKATMAYVLCKVGDSVTHIQPKAFLRDGPWNRITSCANIPEVRLSAWTDRSCMRSSRE